LGEGDAIGSKKVKFHDVDFVMSRGEKLGRGFASFGRNFVLILDGAAVE
jgi:hypothetical protein